MKPPNPPTLNPSIERTPYGMLGVPSVAAHVEHGRHRKRHMALPERIWVGPRYNEERIFVLGESWFGDYEGDLVTDHGYITAYLAGSLRDRLYSCLAEACGPDRRTYWESVMFTNFVQRVGPTRDHRPGEAQYIEAQHRLRRILAEHQPCGVWVLGKGQGKYSAPVVRSAGIEVQVSAHPSSHRGERALLLANLRVSWEELRCKVAMHRRPPDGQEVV
jgi:hypothetical protein